MDGQILSPYQSGMYIAEHSDHVKINQKGVQKLADVVSFISLAY